MTDVDGNAPQRPLTPGPSPDGRGVQGADPDRLREIADRIVGAAPSAPEPMMVGEDDADAAGPSDATAEDIDHDICANCAGLDHSDTDNGARLRAHFGRDLIVMAMGGAAGGDWLCYTGAHWDFDNGASEALKAAQRLGARIAMEAAFLGHTPPEQEAIEAAAGLSEKTVRTQLSALLKAQDRDEAAIERSHRSLELIEAAQAAKAALEKRRANRRKFAVSSKNQARIKAMLDMAAPHLRRPADAFNANPFLAACKTHTLHFRKIEDPENPGDGTPRWKGEVKALAGHEREDLITSLLPVAYDPAAAAPLWRAALLRFLPDADKRRTVQQFTGLSLLGLPVQRLMYHYGLGANFKSTFLETISRVMGESFAVALPAESLTGAGERQAGTASPDIVRLFGKRFLRVPEMPPAKPIDAELIKRLTGGEKMAVRTLFKGFFEFLPIAKTHMSGNDKPIVDGADGALFRRLLLVHWTETIAENERRDSEEVIGEFMAEASGILNWMIEGVLDFLSDDPLTGRKGGTLHVAASVAGFTEEYRQERDPIGQFIGQCIEVAPGHFTMGDDIFRAYQDWCIANSRAEPKNGTALGRELGKRFVSKPYSGRKRYHDLQIVNVPARAAPQPRHEASGDWERKP